MIWKLIWKSVLSASILAFVASCAFSHRYESFDLAESRFGWSSAVDAEYGGGYPNAYKDYMDARSLLDGWRGQGDILATAKEILDGILADNSQFAPAYIELARYTIMDGYRFGRIVDPEALTKAKALVMKALALEPRYADAYVLLGHVHSWSGNYDAAEEALLTAERLGTRNPWLHLNYADILHETGKPEEAYLRYVAVIQSGVKNGKAMGAAYSGAIEHQELLNNYAAVDHLYQKRIELEPNNAWAYGSYAMSVLRLTGDYEKAIGIGRKALSIMDYGVGRKNLAAALYTKWALLRNDSSRAGEACQALEEARSIYANPLQVAFELGSYEHTRSVAEAILSHVEVDGHTGEVKWLDNPQ